MTKYYKAPVQNVSIETLSVKRTSGVRIARAETAFDMSRNKALRAMCGKLGIGGQGRIMDGLQAFAFADPNKDDKQYLLEVETGSQEPAEVRRRVEGLVKFEQYFAEVFDTSLFNGYLFSRLPRMA